MSLNLVIDRAKCTLRQNLVNDGEESRTLAILTVKGAVAGRVLSEFGAGEPVKWEEVLWDEDGQVRTLGVDTIKFDYEAEQLAVTLDDDTLSQKTMDVIGSVSHVQAKPVFGGHAELSFRLTFMPDARRIQFVWNLPALPWAVVQIRGSVHDSEIEARNSAVG